jgi:ElaB/YqjD/DUF883 family membrane-anchored ribosome-binding protein
MRSFEMANATATQETGGRTSNHAKAHTTTDHLAEKAHEVVDRVAKNSAEAETRIREQADAAAHKVRDAEGRAKAAAERSADKLTSYVEQNPMMSAGIAFVAGVFISSLLRR